MDNFLTVSSEEFELLQKRVNKLAHEKSSLQLIVDMMNKLSMVHGINNTIKTIMNLLIESIGGSGITIYYLIDQSIHECSIFKDDKIINQISDNLVNKVFDSNEIIEIAQDFENTWLRTKNFTNSYHWYLPLTLSNKTIGVIKIENLHIKVNEFSSELSAFLKYVSIILHNEIDNSKLESFYNELSREVEIRKQRETELRESNQKFEISNEALIKSLEEIKKLNENLEKNNDELNNLINTKDKLLSIIGHDLKSPFNSIIGFTELLKSNIRKYDFEKSEMFLNHISNASKNTLNLLNNLIEWAKSQSSLSYLKTENVFVNQLINEIIEVLKPTASIKLITLNYFQPHPIILQAEPNMLKTILRNLISNAIKYSNPGGFVEIKTVEKDGFIEISVKDFGTGINPSVKANLFTIGKNTSIEGTLGEKGTGLGLVLCKEFVEKHGGTIWVDSELQKGSVFYFTIPFNPVNSGDETKIFEFKTEKTFTILIVDDEIYNYLLIEEFLIDSNYSFIHAQNGLEATEIIKSNPQINLILMDIMMPIMDGLIASKLIKDIRPDLPIIAQTAYSYDFEIAKSKNSCFDDIIIKPVNGEILKHIILKFIEKR